MFIGGERAKWISTWFLQKIGCNWVYSLSFTSSSDICDYNLKRLAIVTFCFFMRLVHRVSIRIFLLVFLLFRLVIHHIFIYVRLSCLNK